MKFAKWVFVVAAIYGLVVLIPQYFMEERIGRDFPPPITHPEHFYGFVGVALAWQVAFLIIARDPARYRPLMWTAILEKVAFGSATIVLYEQRRLALPTLVAGFIDLTFAVLFLVAIRSTRQQGARSDPK